jgi:hypothetical protein
VFLILICVFEDMKKMNIFLLCFLVVVSPATTSHRC